MFKPLVMNKPWILSVNRFPSSEDLSWPLWLARRRQASVTFSQVIYSAWTAITCSESAWDWALGSNWNNVSALSRNELPYPVHHCDQCLLLILNFKSVL